MSYIFTKNGTLERPNGITYAQFASASYGDILTYNPTDNPIKFFYFTQSVARQTSEFLKLRSLKNIINKNNALDDIFNFENIKDIDSTLISFSSYHLGSGLEKGSVHLTFYYTGSVLTTINDSKQNGILYDSSSNKIGFILYDEGFIVLTGSSDLSAQTANWEGYGTTHPKWIFFGALSSDNENFACDFSYKTKNELPTMTIFVEANKNEFNHSNNDTYIKSGSYSYSYDSSSFKENDFMEIKKINKSPFISGSANFSKETFITRIGLYDEEKKLIAIADLANPVRKTENREFMFKLKLDI